jgi:hypothetical protein
MSQLIAALHGFADLTRNPQSRNDPLHTGTEPARRLSDEISVHQGFGDGTATALMDQWEAALVDLSRDRWRRCDKGAERRSPIVCRVTRSCRRSRSCEPGSTGSA